MASPQIENGHTDIANELVEALAKTRIPGECMQVVWVVLRKTYGWHKKEDVISLASFVEMTGLKKPTICRALSKMITMCIIKKDNRNGIININKDFDDWKPLSKKIMTPIIKKDNVINNDNKPLSKKIIHVLKESIKESNTSTLSGSKTPDPRIVEIISYLNKQIGSQYKSTTKPTSQFVIGRLNDGFTVEDFKKVIDIKSAQWKNDPKMSEYLRPQTLFNATNFESYLNQPAVQQTAITKEGDY